ncbi:hypothetical protein QTJ16_006948 [Diplocarpon rosae]|uniref:Uncharacterized protein n=1 Tax=Diplocarpon rosae TaxID=946125 RepID=A0AAD9SVJ4_9HELO|nr:hypothetical protein QTJ16_006948 [Diplocarpon rosae]
MCCSCKFDTHSGYLTTAVQALRTYPSSPTKPQSISGSKPKQPLETSPMEVQDHSLSSSSPLPHSSFPPASPTALTHDPMFENEMCPPPGSPNPLASILPTPFHLGCQRSKSLSSSRSSHTLQS